MKYLRATTIALLLACNHQAVALSDSYYSEAMDIDYALADDDLPLKIRLETAIQRLVTLVSPDDQGLGFSINLNFFSRDDD